MPCLELCSDGAFHGTAFDFDDGDGWGQVCELQAGNTYCFAVDYPTGGDYTAYMKKGTVPGDFEIPGTLKGYVGQTLWLDIMFEGALSTEVTSSDLTVVNTETGGNAHFHELELLKTGTATVTVTFP